MISLFGVPSSASIPFIYFLVLVLAVCPDRLAVVWPAILCSGWPTTTTTTTTTTGRDNKLGMKRKQEWKKRKTIRDEKRELQLSFVNQPIAVPSATSVVVVVVPIPPYSKDKVLCAVNIQIHWKKKGKATRTTTPDDLIHPDAAFFFIQFTNRRDVVCSLSSPTLLAHYCCTTPPFVLGTLRVCMGWCKSNGRIRSTRRAATEHPPPTAIFLLFLISPESCIPRSFVRSFFCFFSLPVGYVFITPGYNPRQLVIDHTHSDVAVNSQWIPSIKNKQENQKR